MTIVKLFAMGAYLLGLLLFAIGFIRFWIYYSRMRGHMKPGAHQWPAGKFSRYLFLGSFTILTNPDVLDESGLEARKRLFRSLKAVALGAGIMATFFILNQHFFRIQL